MKEDLIPLNSKKFMMSINEDGTNHNRAKFLRDSVLFREDNSFCGFVFKSKQYLAMAANSSARITPDWFSWIGIQFP